MTMRKIEKRIKIPNGKLLIVKAEIANDKIKSVKLQGDFFFYPEEKISLIEKAVVRTRLSELPKTLKSIIHQNKISLCGITVEGICEAMQAVHKGIEAEK